MEEIKKVEKKNGNGKNGKNNKSSKKQKIFNVVIVVLIILLLILSSFATITTLNISIEKPLDGKDAVFLYQWNGTSIRIANSPTNWSNWINLKGNNGNTGLTGLQGGKGDKGLTGNTGATGPSGKNGKDCAPNKRPVVTLVGVGGNRISKCSLFKFWFNVSIDDPENDVMQVDFYYREKFNGNWIHHSTLFGGDEIYGAVITFEYPYVILHKDLYCLVEVWDGSDICLEYYNYTI